MDPQLQQILDRAIADGLNDDDIDLLMQEHASRRSFTTAQAGAEDPKNVFTQDVGTSLGQAAAGAGKQLVDAVSSVGSAVMHPLDTIAGATQARHEAWNKGNDPNKGIVERGAYKVAGLIPFLGPAMVAAGEKLGSGDPETMGRGALDTAATVTGVSPSTRAAAVKTAKTVAPKAAAAADRAFTSTKGFVENHPAASAAIGAGIGYYHGGPVGMIEGAMGGPMVSRLLRAVDKHVGKSEMPKPAAKPGKAKTPAVQQPRLVKPAVEKELADDLSTKIDAMQRPAAPDMPDVPLNLREEPAPTWVKDVAAQRSAAPPASKSPSKPVTAEAAPKKVEPKKGTTAPKSGTPTGIDYRTTDAVPIDAIKRDISQPGGSIYMAGESNIGILEQLAKALKSPVGQESAIEALRKAASQRMNIQGERAIAATKARTPAPTTPAKAAAPKAATVDALSSEVRKLSEFSVTELKRRMAQVAADSPEMAKLKAAHEIALKRDSAHFRATGT